MTKDTTSKAALFMGPMARKKTVNSKYVPNSYRVISQEAESGWLNPMPKPWSGYRCKLDSNILGQPLGGPPTEHRRNRPNPNNVNFLRQDVHLLNDPVCDVHTTATKQEQHVWWNHLPSKEVPSLPEHTLDTTVRGDFQYRGSNVTGNTRHSSNPNTIPVTGAAPVTMLKKADGKQRILKEGISYEHQYNSRLDPSYPIRSKRHGSFVWNELAPNQVDHIMDQCKPTSSDQSTDPHLIIGSQPEVDLSAKKTVPVSNVPNLPPIGAL